jgi:hypothetical protein
MTHSIPDYELNEDWPKAGTFDFWNSDGSQVSHIGELWPRLGLPPSPDELAEIWRMQGSAAWLAAPQSLKDEAAAFLAEYGDGDGGSSSPWPVTQAQATAATSGVVKVRVGDLAAKQADHELVDAIIVKRWGSAGMTALRRWYEDGADGQINWGEPGDFEQCVRVAGKYISDPAGFCQLRHIAACGEPAGPHAHEGK